MILTFKDFSKLQVEWGDGTCEVSVVRSGNSAVTQESIQDKDKWELRMLYSLNHESSVVTGLTFEILQLSLKDNEDVKLIKTTLVTNDGFKTVVSNPVVVEGKGNPFSTHS